MTSTKPTFRIAVEGSIGAGKSDVLKTLAKCFQNIPVYQEPIDEWEEYLSKFYENQAQWSLPLSLKVLLSFGRVPECVCICERSPLSNRYVFTQMLSNDGMPRLHFDLYKDYYDTLCPWEPDAILYVDTPADVCLERIKERGRACEQNIDITYLKRLEFMYESNLLKFYKKPVIRLDGTLSKEALGNSAVDAIRQIL